MKTTLEIATELNVKKYIVAHVIKQNGIHPTSFDGNRRMFDNNAVEIIKKHLGIESYIFLSGTPKELIFESKMNYES